MNIEEMKNKTPIIFLDNFEENKIYCKRDDLIPFSFGGNKARKAILFWKDFHEKKCDCIVTYGSSSSNHCRIIANLSKTENVPCYIISPRENYKETFNSIMIKNFNAKVIMTDIENVHDTIEKTVNELRLSGFNPYFIPGGGHGNLGTEAYVICYEEILKFELENKVKFDYIFFASGTGTTQAGLICGKLIHNENHNIIGISIARKSPYGREVILKSIQEYMKDKVSLKEIEKNLEFDDMMVLDGYGKSNNEIDSLINYIMGKYGLPLDSTYTGKAFLGMKKFIQKNKIKNKNILFIHTGGSPLYFDFIRRG